MRLEVHPKQLAVIQSTARKTLTDGGRGSGKTRAMAIKLAMRATVPGAREGLVRKHLSSLIGTTLKTLLEGDGTAAPVLPPGTYTHDVSKRRIRIHGGGEIVYFGLKDARSAGSHNLTGLSVEELIELSEEDFRYVEACVRVEVPGLPNLITAACNPSVPSHWVAKEWGLAMGHKPAAGTARVFCNPRDNPFLPRSYVEALESLTGVARARFLEGKWVGSEGLVYDYWNRDVHVVDRPEPAGGWARILIGVDEGYTNPFAALRGCVDGDGRLHIEREYYSPGQLQRAKVAAVKAFEPFETAVVDPSAADLIAEFLSAGLTVTEADNAVLDGIQRVQGRLARAGDDQPRLTVSPTCENLIREMETYEWRKLPSGAIKDEPKKEHDHACDALRYLVSHLDAGPRIIGVWVGGDRPKGDPRPVQDTVQIDFAKLRQDPDWGFA